MCCGRKPTGSAIVQEVRGYELMNQRLRQRQVQTRIAAGYGMADAIALSGIEEQHVVRVRHGLIVADMPRVDAAIGKHEMRRGRGLFGTAMPGTCPGSRHSAP
jgi:hypothetical protein